MPLFREVGLDSVYQPFFSHLPVSPNGTKRVHEPVVFIYWHGPSGEWNQAHRKPPFFHRFTTSVGGRGDGLSKGDDSALGGVFTSWSAWVGHEPMHERQPTHCSSTTTTGRFGFVRPSGEWSRGRSASNGQCGMQRSQPVQSASMIATIDCPMILAYRRAS